MSPNSRQRGFTLLEMVVAIGIFAIIAAIAYGSFIRFLDTRDRLAERHAELRKLQRAFTAIDRDLRYVVPRKVRINSYGDQIGALVADDTLEEEGQFLEASIAVANRDSSEWSDQRRVSWSLVSGSLYRTVWGVLDRVEDTETRRRRLLEDVHSVSLRFAWHDKDDEFRESETWPPEFSSVDDSESPELPEGVSVELVMGDNRIFRRVVEIAFGG